MGDKDHFVQNLEGGQIDSSSGNGPRKVLKIACVAIGEMGHFMPISKIAVLLKERGHEVHLVTQGIADIREKCKLYVNQGISMHYTDDGMDMESMLK